MTRRKSWTLGDLKDGIERFYKENSRFPTVSDLDHIDYLPSSRWIQYKFGGIIKVRKDLGYEDVHLDDWLLRKPLVLPEKWQVLTKENFFESISVLLPYIIAK